MRASRRPSGSGRRSGWDRRLEVGGNRRLGGVWRVRGEGRDALAQGGVGSEDSVVAVAVDAWRWDQAGEGGKEPERSGGRRRGGREGAVMGGQSRGERTRSVRPFGPGRAGR
jgi:hypothetical protein